MKVRIFRIVSKMQQHKDTLICCKYLLSCVFVCSSCFVGLVSLNDMILCGTDAQFTLGSRSLIKIFEF